MKLEYHSYHLPFKHPFTISKGTKTHQPTLIVSLEFMGMKGYGEAPAISYYDVSIEKMIEDIESKKSFIEKFAFTEPGRYWHYLHHLLPQNPFLVCALDMAAWDLFGKMKNKSLYQFWKLDLSNIPVTDYTIGIDTIDKMIAKMKEKPWPIYKIKLGTDQDMEIMTSLRKHTDALFRVDANAGWSLAKAMEILPVLKDLGVELIEQPLPKDHWEEMKILFENSPLPLIADESCVREEDVEKCHGYFHGINIKLTKCSGLTPAKRMIEKARELDLQVMVGSMNESSVGSAAIAQLLPLVDFVDMDGPLLLDQDLATGLEFRDGRAILTPKPGLGIEFTGPHSPVST